MKLKFFLFLNDIISWKKEAKIEIGWRKIELKWEKKLEKDKNTCPKL